MAEAEKSQNCKMYNFTFDKDPDCSDKSHNRLSGARDLRTLCVVENMFDLISIENSGNTKHNTMFFKDYYLFLKE